MRACSSAEGREVLSGVKPSYSCLKERSRDYCPQDRDLWGKRHHTHKKSNVPIYVIWGGIFPVHHITLYGGFGGAVAVLASSVSFS